MKVEDVKKVGIVGCGTMGPTIAATVSLKYDVVVKEVNQALADKGRERIAACFPILVKRGKLTEEQKDAVLSRLKVTTVMEDLKDCQVIIDAVPDDPKLKGEILSSLNKMCPPETIFTTTSSILPITALAAASGRPDRMIGTHFCNPAHLMALVEVAPALQTSQQTVDFAMEFCRKLEKTPVKCKDWPGFIVNYLLFPFLISAIKAYQNGLATPEEIDAACKLGLGHPMGPFELLDMVAIDTCIVSMDALYKELQDERFALPPLLKRMHEAGYLGRKVGRGFYDYTKK